MVNRLDIWVSKMGKTPRLGLAVDYSMLRPLTEGVQMIQIKNIIKKDH